MAEHLTEEQQVEAIKKWWKENGTSVIAGLVIGFAALFGWRYWQDYTTSRSEAAAAVYARMMTTLEQDNREKSAQLARRVVDRYDDTPYATLSALALARLAEEAGEAQQARGHYDWVINNTRQPEMKHIARLRLARVVLSAGDAATAMGLVKDVESGTFLADYEELKGDIFVSMNDPRQARDAYNKALAAMQPGAPGRGQLQLKLDDLATTGQSPEASS